MSDVTVIGRGTRVRGRVSLGGGRSGAGAADLEIHGYLEGEAVLDGELTVEATGLVAANLTARRIVVRGAVRGDLTAEESIVLEEGARVVGDVRAPRLAVAAGAFVRGEVQAGDVDGVEAPRARASGQAASQGAAQVAGRAPQRAAAPAAESRGVPSRAATPAATPAPSAAVARPAPQPHVATKPAPAPAASIASRLAGGLVAARAAEPVRVSNAASERTASERAASDRAASERAAIIDLDNAPTVARSGGPPPPVVPALKKGAKGALNKKRA